MTDKLIEILAETLEADASQLPADLDFHTHPRWDSLAALTLMTAVEDEYGVVLSDQHLRSAASISALAVLIRSLKSA
ncbi:MAG: acyl carrier protein [Roseateles sp.]|uniref:acyl carrier protein n=1 Tax=Roseateles sp. TaxID=1971397 RepID=UPI0039E895E2